MDTYTFGEYINSKRKEQKLTLRKLAEKLDISPTYLSDVENDRRKSFPPDKLLLLSKILNINTEKDLYYYFDLAGYSRNSIAYDVESFMLNNPELIEFVRKIKYKKVVSIDYINNLLTTINDRERITSNEIKR